MRDNIPIWRLKYLPHNLTEICGRIELTKRLLNIVEEQNFPHLLFVGPEGIGKTTIATLFSKAFLGKYFASNFQKVYADTPLTSEELKQARSDAYVSTNRIGSLAGKKITTPAFIQIKIKPFIELKALGDVPFKILIVKNFESLGSNQQAFRRLMEIYGKNCRMILITTKVSAIIDPIISRCQIFLISPPDYENFKDEVEKIVDKEAIEIEEDTIELLYRVCGGKIADAIDLLQIASISGKKVDREIVYQSLMTSRTNLVRNLLLICLQGDFQKARELSRKIQSDYKYSSQELFNLFQKEVFKLPLSRYARSHIINIIADADFRAIDGMDIDIQVSNLIAKLCDFAEVL
jgi:DNA polymerase III delta prime subunit